MPKTRCAATNEELASLAKAGSQEARNQLWEQNRGLLLNLFRPYFPLCKKYRIETDDMLQLGLFVIIRAVKSYDPTRPYPFHAYLRYGVKLELRGLLGASEMSRREAPARMQVVSLNAPVGEGGAELQDNLEDVNVLSSAEKAENEDMCRIVREEVERLPGQERRAIESYYLEGKTYEQVATMMDVGPDRTRQICSAGLRRMRKVKRLQEFRQDAFDRFAYRSGFQRFVNSRASAVEKTVEYMEERGLL